MVFLEDGIGSEFSESSGISVGHVLQTSPLKPGLDEWTTGDRRKLEKERERAGFNHGTNTTG